MNSSISVISPILVTMKNTKPLQQMVNPSSQIPLLYDYR